MTMENLGYWIQFKKLKKSFSSKFLSFSKKLDNEYLPIDGDAEFIKLSTKLAYGEN